MRTVHKTKLPQHLSYPVGLQRLATALECVPQAAELGVSFYAHAGAATAIEHQRRDGEYCPVLVARFDHSRLGLSECTEMRERGLYDPHWGIEVYAVSRANRAVASQLLTEIGIPAIVNWLQTPRSETWLQGRKQIVVSLNEKEGTILVKTEAD